LKEQECSLYGEPGRSLYGHELGEIVVYNERKHPAGIRLGSGVAGAKTEAAGGFLPSVLGGGEDLLPALKGSGVGSSTLVNRRLDLRSLKGALVRSH
jgi:hypothetical protein